MKKRKGLFLLGLGVSALMAVRAHARNSRAMSLIHRIVVITGGSRGLGLVMARQFAGRGANVVLVARDATELAQAEEDLRPYGVEVMTIACDVTDKAQAEAMIAQVMERFGEIDILVNNAGSIQVGPMEEMTLTDYEEAMRIHYWAPLYTTLAVLPAMRRRRSGRIVNIASIGGKVSVPHLLPYSASKFALVGLSEGMRAELAKDNVFVTTVCPGLMRTGSHVNAKFKGQHRAEYAWFSIGDSLPFSSIDARTAAEQILCACKYGDAELTISLPAQALAAFHGLFPGVTADLFGVVNKILPGPGGIGAKQVSGRESESLLAPSLLTALSDRAVLDNNEAD